MNAAKQRREAKSKATMQGIMGALLLIGAAAAADQNNSALENTAVVGAAIGGGVMLQRSFASSAEGKYHRETLLELGQSLNFEVAPMVVDVEESNVTVRGDVKEQYRHWRSMMQEFYELESTPNIQL